MSQNQGMWMYYLYRVAGATLPRLPAALGYALFTQLGKLMYHLATPARLAVRDNMRHVLGPEASEARLGQVARQIFITQARNYFDLFRVPSLRNDEILKRVRLYGVEHFNEARALGKGVVLVSIHFGNLDIVAQSIAIHGYPVLAIAEHLKPDALYRYVSSLRASKGIHVIPADGFLKAVFRALAHNEAVALAADRDTTHTGIVMDFFGAPAHLPIGYAQLALRTGAPVVPAFGLRRPHGYYEGYVEPPVLMESSGDREDDARRNAQRLLPLVEAYISKYPEQWIMFRPLWRVDEA